MRYVLHTYTTNKVIHYLSEIQIYQASFILFAKSSLTQEEKTLCSRYGFAVSLQRPLSTKPNIELTGQREMFAGFIPLKCQARSKA